MILAYKLKNMMMTNQLSVDDINDLLINKQHEAAFLDICNNPVLLNSLLASNITKMETIVSSNALTLILKSHIGRKSLINTIDVLEYLKSSNNSTFISLVKSFTSIVSGSSTITIKPGLSVLVSIKSNSTGVTAVIDKLSDLGNSNSSLFSSFTVPTSEVPYYYYLGDNNKLIITNTQTSTRTITTNLFII